LSQQTFIGNADNLLSIHQTTNNTQEVASTMEESPQEMTGVLKQTMISLQKLMSELNQIEENSKRVEKENQEMKRVINQLEEKSKRMEKENQEMKKEIQKMKEKIENQSEMKK
jgi:chromosome segregation ATPase